jgi:hypothetical protein
MRFVEGFLVGVLVMAVDWDRVRDAVLWVAALVREVVGG